MLSQNEIEQINRYVDGKADEKDIACIEKLFSQGHENFDLRNYLKKDWENDVQNTTPSKASLFRMQNHIHRLIREEDQTRNLFICRIPCIRRIVAAILLLPLIIGGSLTLSLLGKVSNNTRENQFNSLIHMIQELPLT